MSVDWIKTMVLTSPNYHKVTQDAEAGGKIRILLADEQRIVREGLRSLLEAQPGMKVIAEAETGRIAVQLALKLGPDVALMDSSMPDLNGIDATRQIVAGSHVKVICLSAHSTRQFVTEMLKAGASGYLLKDCCFEEVRHAINIVVANQSYISPTVAGTLINSCGLPSEATGSSAFDLLTCREREVLQLIAEGRSTKQIASQLYVSAKTIETHRRQIMQKLNIFSIAGLTKFAVREGLTTLDAGCP
jgi:two-component system response regulator NreC